MILIALILSFLTNIVTVLLEVHLFSHVWSWFLAEQYGPGPTLAAWFGLATVLTVIVNTCLLAHPTEKSENDPVTHVITRSLGTWIGLVVVYVLTWCTGSLLGWVS